MTDTGDEQKGEKGMDRGPPTGRQIQLNPIEMLASTSQQLMAGLPWFQ